MIKSISIENWRTHKNSEMEFDAGTNVIVGVMGAGKSSVVNALSYGLFGTFPALKSKQVTLDEVIMAKPNKESNARVKATLNYNGKEYVVERAITLGKTNTAKLFEDGKLVAGPKQKDVNERVEKILGVNYDLFSRAIYSEQNETDFFLKLSPRERKQKFDDLLNLEKYENARRNSVSLQNQFKRRIKGESDFVENQKKNINAEDEKKLLKNIEGEKKEIIKFEKEIGEIKKDVISLEKRVKEIQSKESENKVYEDLLVKIESRIESLKEDLEKDGKISLEKVQKELEKAKKDLSESESVLKEEKKKIEPKKAALGKNKEERKVLEYKKRQFQEELDNIGKLGGKCHVCKQKLDEDHKKRILKENRDKIKDAEQGIEKLLKEAKTLEEDIEKSEKLVSEKDSLVDSLKKQMYSLGGDERKAKEVEEKKKELDKLKDEPKKLNEEIKKIGFDKALLDKVKNDFYERKSSLETIETKISSKNELIKSHEHNLKHMQEIKKNIEDLEKRIGQSKKVSEDLGVFSNCLVATQTELRESLISTLNDAMSTIWENIYPYQDYTDAKLAVTDDGYDLMVKNRNKEWIRVDGILSGGERSAAAICIRIAFALVLTKNLSMLILDEPTHNLDSNAIGKLSEMLREKLPGLVDQIFIITHDKQLATAASASLYVLQRNKDLDEATRIEKS